MRQINNNEWLRYTESDSAIVFIHGLMSNSTKCWLYESENSPKHESYWPDLVASDPRFGNSSIYISGYATGPNSGDYNIKNCSDEVFAALRRSDPQNLGRQTVMQKQKITFICHSMGGIVARHFLIHQREHFQGKAVGLVLIASPSNGSEYANLLKLLSALYGNEQVARIKVDDPTLRELSEQFRDLKEKFPTLSGVEFYETRHPFAPAKWWNPLSSKKLIVSKSSAVQFFNGRAIPNTDHFTICTPKTMSCHIHGFLYDFLRDHQLLPAVEGERKKSDLDSRQAAEKISSRENHTEHRPGVSRASFLPKELSNTMSNPKYAEDISKLDQVFDRQSVINLETIIIVVGTSVVAELLDRPVAEILRDRIDALGGEYPFRRALVVTDAAWYSDKENWILARNPVIAIGGPRNNEVSAEFDRWVAPPKSREGTYLIPGGNNLRGFFRHNDLKLPQVALWGEDAAGTRSAVEHYVENSKGLPDFINIIWKPR
jgi:pimeloyl-ACP methyl ester carboxylesterase